MIVILQIYISLKILMKYLLQAWRYNLGSLLLVILSCEDITYINFLSYRRNSLDIFQNKKYRTYRTHTENVSPMKSTISTFKGAVCFKLFVGKAIRIFVKNWKLFILNLCYQISTYKGIFIETGLKPWNDKK